MKARIDYLDGLRGIAILLVIAFHAYSRWPEIVPYGDTYQDFPIFKFGWLGVQLFFMISGFVIFMTLDKTTTFHFFIYKRWLRLFPAMLLASLLIYASSFVLDARPAGTPNLLNLIPGLTFIEPSLWSLVTGVKINGLEGAFWSLYVEFKFYVLAGFIYFFLGRKLLTPCLLLLFVGSLIISYISSSIDNQLFNVAQKICAGLSFQYFGWFAAGSIFYLFCKTKKANYFFMALAVSVLSAVFVDSVFIGSMYDVIAALITSLFFAMSLKVDAVQRFLTNRILVFFGFISYPLYLIHENAMISMIVQFSDYQPWLNMLFYPVLPIAILSATAFLIASRYEKTIRLLIENFVQLKLHMPMKKAS